MTTIFITIDPDGSHRIKLQSDVPTAFRLAIDTLKSWVPAHHRTFDPTVKEWRVEGCAIGSFHRWLAYCSSTLGAQIERLNTDSSHKGRESASPRQPQKTDAYRTLYLLPEAPPELVKAAYRALAQIYHPDHGGDTEAMQRINEAYRMLAA